MSSTEDPDEKKEKIIFLIIALTGLRLLSFLPDIAACIPY